MTSRSMPRARRTVPACPCARAASRRTAAGYALFEALIAVIVLSVGFVGAARMQTVGLKLNSSAHSRQKASLLAYQMTDRIRANRSANYLVAAATSTACLTDPAGCSAADMAGADTTLWQADLAAQLPAGSGTVCHDSTPGDGHSPADDGCDGAGEAIVVKVFWTDNVATGGSVFATAMRPQ